MRKVRPSIWPGQTIEVDETEYQELVFLGLIEPDKPASERGKEETRNERNSQ
jgi:hypothetical protein